MEKCPKCGKYMVAYDGYRKIKRCHMDGCSTHIYEDGSYSVLEAISDKAVVRIKIAPNGDRSILKKYKLFH